MIEQPPYCTLLSLGDPRFSDQVVSELIEIDLERLCFSSISGKFVNVEAST